ncbi:MAG: S8 family serine peptidase [Bacteroidota bacterium]
MAFRQSGQARVPSYIHMMDRIFLFPLLSFVSLFLHAQARIDPELIEAWILQEQAEVLIVMKEQPQISFAQSLTSKEARGQYVYAMATQLAEDSQAQLRDHLQDRDIAHHPYSIVNAIWANLTAAEAELIATFPGVARLDPNPWIRQDLGWSSSTIGQSRSAVEWGIERIGSTALWAEGIRGAGVVVGGQDTGYDWDHPALISQYRGNLGDTVMHDYHWHDAIRELNPMNNGGSNPCGLDSAEPCDDHNHGTHTMGTMIGDDGEGNQIGVAPEASWMACRNMERGYGSPASYIECFEFFLAPTRVDGSEPDPNMAPDVIANSWSCPEIEGCNPGNFELMETAINNLRASGVVVVTSAGNSGPNCETVSTPPSIFAGAFAVGATASNDSIAGFSSRGPVGLDGSGRLQPQVVAPGVAVRSSIRDGQYASFQGTSMAGPHVAGAVALLISARPGLAGQVEQIEEILSASARPLFSSQDCAGFPGNESPNAVYGHGLIDLEQALTEADIVLSTSEATDKAIDVSVFPNPTSDQLNILSDGEDILSVELYDLLGQRLLTIRGERRTILTIHLKDLPSGSYLASVQTSAGYASRLFNKQ